MIIDAHVHIFNEFKTHPGQELKLDLGYGSISVGDRVVRVLPPLNERTVHSVEMLLTGMDWAGVEKAVLLQGPFYGECNQVVSEAVSRFPDRLVGAAYFDPWSNHRDEFESIVDPSVFCALKLEFTKTGLSGLHEGARLDAPNIAWIWDELEKKNLVLTIDLGGAGDSSYQTDELNKIAEEHPKLKIVICHLALPKPEIEAEPSLWKLWNEQIELGNLPNVWFDFSAIPYYLQEEGYPFPTIGRYLKIVSEKIGPEKIMWGTDIPVLLTIATYPQLLSMAKLHTEFLTNNERDLILGKNAEQVYGF